METYDEATVERRPGGWQERGGRMIEVYDNRLRECLMTSDPIIKGDVIKVSSWAESTSICITLDTGYRIILPKTLVIELVKAAEQQ